MDQLITFLEIGAWSVIVALPIVAIVRFIAGSGDLVDGISLTYREATWPRGVQEEEPVRFRLEYLRRSPRPVEDPRGLTVATGAGSAPVRACAGTGR